MHCPHIHIAGISIFLVKGRNDKAAETDYVAQENRYSDGIPGQVAEPTQVNVCTWILINYLRNLDSAPIITYGAPLIDAICHPDWGCIISFDDMLALTYPTNELHALSKLRELLTLYCSITCIQHTSQLIIHHRT